MGGGGGLLRYVQLVPKHLLVLLLYTKEYFSLIVLVKRPVWTLLYSIQCRKTETTQYFNWGDFSYRKVVAYKTIGRDGGAGSQRSHCKRQNNQPVRRMGKGGDQVEIRRLGTTPVTKPGIRKPDPEAIIITNIAPEHPRHW